MASLPNTKCDTEKEYKCIVQLKRLILALIQHRKLLENQLEKFIPITDQLIVHTIKLHILENNNQGDFFIYDEQQAKVVAKKYYLKQKPLHAELQRLTDAIAESFIAIRTAYDNFKESTTNIDWNVNSTLITGDVNLKPLKHIVDESCDILFYFKVFSDNLKEKMYAVQTNRTQQCCIKKLVNSLNVSMDFLLALDVFVLACENQIKQFDGK